MRRMIAALLAAAGLAVALSGPAAADHSHPFCGSGREYAHEHVVALAQAGVIGPVQGGGIHVPGVHHGFAVCLDVYP